MKFEKNFAVTDNMFDENEIIKPSAILDLFQTIAGDHVNHMGCGIYSLGEKNYAWILMRFRFDCYKRITRYQELKLTTWPHEPKKVEFNREYEIFDKKTGELICRGFAKWVIIDINTKRIERCSSINYPYTSNEENYYTDLPRISYQNEVLTDLGSYQVRRTDLDINKHMNNSKYADFVSGNLKSFEINYLYETKENEIIDLKGNDHLLIGMVNDKVHFVIKYIKE